MRWIETTSAAPNSSSFSTGRAPAPATAFSGQVLAPGDHLHAERLTDRADLAAEPAEPEEAERLPPRSRPTVICQPPARIAASSLAMPRTMREDERPGQLGRADGQPARCRRRGCRGPPPPRRRSRRCAAPVVTSSRRSGSCSRTARGNGVRSRIATTISAPFSRRASSAWSEMLVANALGGDLGSEALPVGHRERDVRVVVEDHRPHASLPSVAPVSAIFYGSGCAAQRRRDQGGDGRAMRRSGRTMLTLALGAVLGPLVGRRLGAARGRRLLRQREHPERAGVRRLQEGDRHRGRAGRGRLGRPDAPGAGREGAAARRHRLGRQPVAAADQQGAVRALRARRTATPCRPSTATPTICGSATTSTCW